MEGRCNWCKKESDKLEQRDTVGKIVYVCKECIAAEEADVCITCGNDLYGTYALNGECAECNQIREAESEKLRSEVMNGLGVDVLSKLTHSVVFTEEDYEKWVTFGQVSLSPERIRDNRRAWIKNKLIKECGWETEVFNANVEDIEWLLENHSSHIFKKNCTFMINNGNSRGLRALNIVAKHGKVMVVDKE